MKIIYGPKGTGKTQTIINMANNSLKEAQGYVLFVTDNGRCSRDIDLKIRFIDITSFDIKGMDGFRGFLKGIVAANGDNEIIYVDGIARITGKNLAELGNIFEAMEKMENDFGVEFVLTCSAEKKDLPDFVLKYVE